MIKKIFIVFISLAFLSPLKSVFARDLAVVVNKANPVSDLSSKELIKIFKEEKQYWEKERISLLMREQGSWEKELILKKVYEMSDEELKKFWLGKMFRGEVTTFPAVFGSESMIKKLIANLAGAISFIDNQSIDSNVKVVGIDGKLPGQEGYLLKE